MTYREKAKTATEDGFFSVSTHGQSDQYSHRATLLRKSKWANPTATICPSLYVGSFIANPPLCPVSLGENT